MADTTDDYGSDERIVIFDMPSCGGCRTCELACSFHHTGEFSPEHSSLRITDKQSQEGYQVQLAFLGHRACMACDGCQGLDVPLCVEHCRESDDLTKILYSFEEKRNQKDKNRDG